MHPQALSPGDLEVFHERLAPAVASARSLDDITAWLTSQPFVASVELADYLLKSNPPQREFIVEFRMVGGSTVKKIVNIFELGNRQYRFHTLRDQS